jgi:sugar phosphate isomerase/epimerase
MQYQFDKYPSLTKSYKNLYPFKIGTTSFIYPDLYLPNVKMLGPFVDEIELLLFESAPVASLLSKAVIRELKRLAQDLRVSYNIHLPTDISICDAVPIRQDQAVDTLVSIIERVALLSPSSYTLHVPYPSDANGANDLREWQHVVYRNLEKIVFAGVPAGKIAIETLDYPIGMIAQIIDKLNLSICLDVGHLMLQGYDIKQFFGNYGDKVSIIHLHGVKNCRDHLSLDNQSKEFMKSILDILEDFTKNVSVEVFSYKDLRKSLRYFEECWQSIKKTGVSSG